MCSCFNICVMTVFQRRANVFFCPLQQEKNEKFFTSGVCHVFWSWSLQTVRQFCLPTSFYRFVFFAGGCWSSSSSDDSKRAARFRLAECFGFLLPGCCCASVMQVDVRYCFKPLMVGFALKWATSFAVPTAYSAYHSGFVIRAFTTEKWVPRRNMALPILTISSKNTSTS